LVFEVFLTKKGGEPSKGAYAGSITFFGREAGDDEHAHHLKDGFTQGFDVTRLVQGLRSANKGELPEMDVLVVPHSTAGLSDAELAKQKVVIPISNITLKLVTTDQKK
jgi:hypothetical protein